jgi:hypothetical protein
VGVPVLVGAGVLAAGAVPAAAQGDRAGDVVVVDTNGDPISNGGTDTTFGMRLPSDAACQGDSATAGYRVSTFLVPAGDDPGSLTYEELKPVGDGRWSIWKDTTDPALNMLTSVSGEGQPGAVVDLPQFTFDVGLFPGEIASGDYRLGLACTLGGETTRYWDTAVTIAEGENEPVIWSTAGASPGSSSTTAPTLPILVAVAVAGVAIGVVVLVSRRRVEAGSRALSKEEK